MPFDPYNAEDMQRLRRVIREQRQKFAPYRENRKVLLDAINDPCHRSYEVDSLDRKPHNPLDKFVRIVTRGVVDQNPSLRIVRSKRPRVSGMLRSQLVDWARDVDMADVLQDMFIEGLLRWGTCYTGYETPDSGYGMNPFVRVLDFDDYFIDTRGNDEDNIDFEGHCWARRLYEIQRDASYDQNVVDRLSEGVKTRYRNETTTLYPWIDLRCVWLPEENVELTITDDENNIVLEPLRVRPYVGPPPGPYLRLSLGDVRGTMVPVSRMSMLYDLHEFVVRAYRQVYTQADRAMEGYAYDKNSEKDAEKHRTLIDGEYVGMDNPKGIEKITKGGVNPQTLAAAIHADDLFDTDAGNLKLVGGLGPSAETLGQERGLGVGVQAMIDDMRTRMNKLAKRLYEVAGWYILRDPLRLNRRVEDGGDPNTEGGVMWTTGNGNTVRSTWTPEIAAGMNPDEQEMEIIPGSMVSRSAEGQLQFLVQSVQAVASMMALPGNEQEVFHHRRFKELMAEYGNAPELNELFGEAPNAESVVPGVEAAGQFARPPARSSGGNGQPKQSKMVERMIFSGGAQTQPA
jgi:hypothetical protein